MKMKRGATMAENRGKELARNTFIITLGRVSTQFISFILLPLYTSKLSVSEFGTVDLISTIVQLLIPVISLMIDQGCFRFLINCSDDTNKKIIVTTSFGLQSIFSVVFLIVYCPICIIFNFQYKIFIALILIVTAYSNLFLQVARGLRKTVDYSFGSFVCSITTILINIICIILLKMGASGMLSGSFLGNLICCIYLFFRLNVIKYLSFKSFKLVMAKKELKYSVPLVPNQISLWVMNSSDRLIVAYILGTAANGILAVSHKFPTIYLTFFNIFQLAWHETGAIHYFDSDRDEFFSEMLEKVISIFSTLCVGLIIGLPLVFNMLIDISYHDAYYNIPIYLVASLFNVVVGLLGVVYVALKKTGEIAKTTIIATILNIVISIFLIKFIGLFAASISTFVGYLVTMIYRIVDTKKYLNIRYNIKQYVFIFCAIVVSCLVYYSENLIMSVIAVPVFVVIAIMINRKTLSDIIKFSKKKLGS